MSPPVTVHQANDERRQQLLRVQRELSRVQEQIASVSARTRELLAIQEQRPLTEDEYQLSRRLSTEAECLLHTLAALRREFREIQARR